MKVIFRLAILLAVAALAYKHAEILEFAGGFAYAWVNPEFGREQIND